MQIDRAVLRRLWPHAPQALVDAVAERSGTAFAAHGLSTSQRVAHFMAQISHESGGGTIVEESLNYTTPARIAAVWPKRFTPASAAAYVHDPKKLADAVYNGRMGNRAGTEDGFNYRGRGLLQITGRENYRAIGALCGLPLEERPELAYAPTATLEVAAAEFQKLGCLPFCDQDNVQAVTRRVNGGYTGLASRKAWLAKWKLELNGESPAAPPADVPVPEPHDQPPEVPRGSDDVLPPGVDHPGKGMGQSGTGWATILATVTSLSVALGQAIDAVKPLLADPKTIAAAVVVAGGAGAFIWFDRRSRMRQDHA